MLIPPSFEPRRILVCQQRQIGDVLLTTPALEALRGRYPDAAIHMLTERKCIPMLERNPHLDYVWPMDKNAMPTLAHEVRWYWKVARTGYDLVINFQPTLPRLRWVVGFSGAAVRLATTPPWYLRPLYTHTLPPSQAYAATAKVDVLKPLGIAWNGERPRLYLADEERDGARELLKALGLRPQHTLVSLDPTHRQSTRRWPLEYYARMAAQMLREGKERGYDFRFLPLWGPGEEEEIYDLYSQVSARGYEHAILMPDRLLRLREAAACIAEASLHIGNCSAPRHIAVAVGTPSCTAMGSTGSEWTCPPRPGLPADHLDVAAQLDCQPCEENICRLRRDDYSPCMVALEPQRMVQAAFSLLDRPTAAA